MTSLGPLQCGDSSTAYLIAIQEDGSKFRPLSGSRSAKQVTESQGSSKSQKDQKQTKSGQFKAP